VGVFTVHSEHGWFVRVYRERTQAALTSMSAGPFYELHNAYSADFSRAEDWPAMCDLPHMCDRGGSPVVVIWRHCACPRLQFRRSVLQHLADEFCRPAKRLIGITPEREEAVQQLLLALYIDDLNAAPLDERTHFVDASID
jgi:hypothetical protein